MEVKRVRRRVSPQCSACKAITTGVRYAGGLLRCEYCLTPLGNVITPPEEKIVKEAPRRRKGDPRIGRRRDRKLAREEAALLEPNDFLASHPGNPLGHGMPLGTSLRYEEESHREAWKRIIRGDICAYCWRPTLPCAYTPQGGTVDHIDPQSGPRPPHGLHTWQNYTGSCGSCNSSKGSKSMLFFMLERSPGGARRREGSSSVPRPADPVLPTEDILRGRVRSVCSQ